MHLAYQIPSEVAEHCLSAAGRARLTRACLDGGKVKPLAVIRQCRGAWVAVFEFEEPFGPDNDRCDHVQLNLAVHPEGGQ